MTMHFLGAKIEDTDPKQIVEAWKNYGKKLPVAFATITVVDIIAYQCWRYLDILKTVPNPPSIDLFCSSLKDDERDKFKAILEEVVRLSKE